jgi:GNAT superfamily N-acetyltransferase
MMNGASAGFPAAVSRYDDDDPLFITFSWKPLAMIRPTLPEDVPELVELAAATGVFKPTEIIALEEVLADYVEEPGGPGYHSYTFLDDGKILGFSTHGPNTMTEGTWDLYWIAVRKDLHRRGVGAQLLQFVEEDVRKQLGRLLMIETSSLPSYDPTRRFYLKHGYEQCAVVPDFYADGDSLVIFRKRLREPSR